MKKFVLAAMLFGLLLVLGLSIVSAGEDWSDPVLCVNGQWLVVNAAKEAGVKVGVPNGTVYGEAGGCADAAPGPVFVSNVVRENGNDHNMHVWVNGKLGSPQVIVSYGGRIEIKNNNGKQTLVWKFVLK
jgi:hypothetical protein